MGMLIIHTATTVLVNRTTIYARQSCHRWRTANAQTHANCNVGGWRYFYRHLYMLLHCERNCRSNCHLTQSQYTDTGPASPSTDPVMPGIWKGHHNWTNVCVTGMIQPGIVRGDLCSLSLEAVALLLCHKVVNSGSAGLTTASLAKWLRHPPQEQKISGSSPVCAEIFPMSSHTRDLKICTPVATPPGTWHYRVSTGTGWPGVSILWLGEVESLICSFYLSVAARKIVWADPSLRYTSLLLGR